MKQVVSIAIVLVCGLAYAQEAEEEAKTSIESEKLNVLEPLVGTFIIEGVDEKTGAKWEWVSTTSWIGPEKKMLRTESKIRRADEEEDLSTTEWVTSKTHHYYVWNSGPGRIEYVNVWGRRGVIVVSEVHPKGNGVYTLSRLSTTESPAGKGDTTVTVTDESLVWKITNRTTADRKPADDMVFNWKRVKEDK